MILFNIAELSAGSLGLFAVIYGVFIFLIHMIMALAVNGDAKRLVPDRRGLFLFGPFVWGWIVFIFGLAGLAVYWAIHHSSLRASAPPAAAPAMKRNRPHHPPPPPGNKPATLKPKPPFRPAAE